MKSENSLYDLKLLPFTALGAKSAVLTSRDAPYEERNEDLYLSITKTNSGNLSRAGLARMSVMYGGEEIP